MDVMNYTDKIRDAKVMRRLGAGSRASVDLYENPDGSQFALKITPDDSIDEQDLGPALREINFLTKLRNQPNVVQIYGFSFQNNHVAIAMEASEANLLEFNFTPESLGKLIADMSSVIAVLEKSGIQHNDFGRHNILYRLAEPVTSSVTGSIEFKLADFGDSAPLKILNYDLRRFRSDIAELLWFAENSADSEWASIQQWLKDIDAIDLVRLKTTDTAASTNDRVDVILQRLAWLKLDNIEEVKHWRDVVTEIVDVLDNKKNHLVSSTADIARIFYTLEGRVL